MKIIRLLSLLLLAITSCVGQNFMTISGTHTYGPGAQLLPTGTIMFRPVDSNGNPIGYQIGGGGQQVKQPTICAVTAGVIANPCQVANTSLTNPVNVCFSVLIKDASNRIIIGGEGSGYTCVRPQTTNFWCAAGTCNFDSFTPNVNAATMALLGPPQTLQMGSIFAGDCPSGQVATGYNVTGHPDCTPNGSGGGGVLDPGNNGIMKRISLNITAPALAADIYATLGYTTANDSLVPHLAGSETFAGAKTFTLPIVGSLTGNAQTSSALDHTPVPCSPTQAARGIVANGDSTGCLSLTAGLGDPGANGLINRTGFNTTAPATLSDVTATLGYTAANNVQVVHNSGAETIGGVKTFSSTIAGSISGNAATSTVLAATPSLCSAGSAPRGVDAGGNASGCGLLGLGDPGNTGVVKRTTFGVTTLASSADINTIFGFPVANDNLLVHLAGVEVIAGAKTFQQNVTLTSVQNRTGDYLPFSNAPVGGSGPDILIIDAPAGYLQIQADSGAGSNQGGVLNLQSSNGPNGIAFASLLVGSSGFQINAAGMTVFSGSSLKTILTGPGITQFGNVGGTRGQPTYVGNTSGSVTAGCADSTCSSFAITGPLTLSSALGTAYGGTGFTDTTFSGNTHKFATVTGTITANCAQFDGSGNLVATANPCGTGSGGLADPGGNGLLKRTALNVTAVASGSDVNTALGYTPANDTLAAHLAGVETFTGVKTFSSTIVGSVNGNAATATALAADPADCGAGSAANGVNASGTATGCIAIPVASSANPLVNGSAAPGTGTTFSRTDHVHPTDTSRAADSAAVHNTGNETIAGVKTFSSTIVGSINGNAATATLATTATTAATATALVADPADCSANSAAVGINASGVAQGCFSPVLVANDIGGTAAAPTVISTHLTGFSANTLPRVNGTGGLVASSIVDDLTTVTITNTGGLSIVDPGGHTGFDGFIFGTAWGVSASTVAITGPTSGTAHNLVLSGTPQSGFLKFSTTVSPTGCTASSTNLCGTYSTVNLASSTDVTGVGLPVNGFTGVASPTAHGIMLAQGASPMTTLSGGLTGQAVIGQTGADPIYSSTLTLGGSGPSTSGAIILQGATSGAVSLKVGATSGTYDYNFPITVGTAGQPLLSGGGSVPMTWGTLSGNTTVFATVSGALVFGNCLKSDVSGNLIDSGSNCAGSGGGVGSGTSPRLAYYDTGSTVASAANTAIGDGTANPVLSLTGTSLAKPSLFVNCTTPANNCVDLQWGGITKLGIDNSGVVLLGGIIHAANGANYQANTALGSVTYSSGINSNANQGDATLQGGNVTGTGNFKAGDTYIQPGVLSNAAPGATATEGITVFNAAALRKGTTVTVGNLSCGTIDNTTADCLTAADNVKFIGVHQATQGGSVYIQTDGTATLNLAASSTWAAWDVVCSSSTSAAQMFMNGTLNCPAYSRKVGYAEVAGTAATTVKTLLALGQLTSTKAIVAAAQTALIATTNIIASVPANSLYSISGAITCNTAVASATATLTLSWTDTSNTAQSTTALATCTTLGASSFSSVDGKRVNAKSGTAITYAVAVANAPNYDVRVEATQLTAN